MCVTLASTERAPLFPTRGTQSGDPVCTAVPGAYIIGNNKGNVAEVMLRCTLMVGNALYRTCISSVRSLRTTVGAQQTSDTLVGARCEPVVSVSTCGDTGRVSSEDYLPILPIKACLARGLVHEQIKRRERQAECKGQTSDEQQASIAWHE